jgi:hypothetical protein
MATPVSTQGTQVKAGPFVGLIARDYDVVDGRFSLRAGGMRTETMSSKIPWFLPRRYRVGPALAITGIRLDAPGRFTQRYSEAFAPTNPGQHVFPTIIAPPRAGCWRITLRTGPTHGTLVALVRG